MWREETTQGNEQSQPQLFASLQPGYQRAGALMTPVQPSVCPDDADWRKDVLFSLSHPDCAFMNQTKGVVGLSHQFLKKLSSIY